MSSAVIDISTPVQPGVTPRWPGSPPIVFEPRLRLADGDVAPTTDIGDDVVHHRGRLVPGDLGPGQVGRGVVQAAPVQNGEELGGRHDRQHVTDDRLTRNRRYPGAD